MELSQNFTANRKKSSPDWLAHLKKEPAVNAYIDLSNAFHWQDALKWQFRLEDALESIRKLPNVKETKVYYGFNDREPAKSKALQKRIRKTGAILITKPVKFIRKTVNEAFLVKRSTLSLFNTKISAKVTALVSEMNKGGVVIEEPKCNFDVEMTMDMMDDADKVSAIILCSGDSDFHAPLQRLKVDGKTIYVVGVRGQVAKELFEVSDYYVDFGKIYYGKKYR